MDANIELTVASKKFTVELNYVRKESNEVIGELMDRLEMRINLNKKKTKYEDSQHRTSDLYLRQIKGLQQRRTVVEERVQKIFQMKKEVKKKKQEKDEMKTEMEEEFPHVQAIKVEETAQCCSTLMRRPSPSLM